MDGACDEKVTASDVEQWFDVENDDDVHDAVVADIFDEMEKITTEIPAQEAEENEVEANEVKATLASLAQLYAMFRPIQESAFLCNLPDASSHLQRALHVFRETIRKSNATAQWQNAHYENASEASSVPLLINFCQHELVRIRNSAEIAALYEGSTISRPPAVPSARNRLDCAHGHLPVRSVPYRAHAHAPCAEYDNRSETIGYH